jgi:hypothetical protein
MTYLSGAIRPELLRRRPDLGVMLQPRAGNRPQLQGTAWAQDNGLYHDPGQPERRFDDLRFLVTASSEPELCLGLPISSCAPTSRTRT